MIGCSLSLSTLASSGDSTRACTHNLMRAACNHTRIHVLSEQLMFHILLVVGCPAATLAQSHRQPHLRIVEQGEEGQARVRSGAAPEGLRGASSQRVPSGQAAVQDTRLLWPERRAPGGVAAAGRRAHQMVTSRARGMGGRQVRRRPRWLGGGHAGVLLRG